MCPLRLVLVFLSATLAGYLAWRAVQSPPPPASTGEDSAEIDASAEESRKSRGFDARKVAGDGFWVFVDMASGRYLWRVLKER